jgi:cell volume regulation protein A
VEEGLILLVVGGVLAASIVVPFGATRAGVPSLVAFLALGMLLGSEGPGGIDGPRSAPGYGRRRRHRLARRSRRVRAVRPHVARIGAPRSRRVVDGRRRGVATLRFTHIRRRLARTLEAETGGNDPVAIALTLGLIDWIRHEGYGFVRQLGLGLVVGVALGVAATWVFARIPHSVGAFAPVASVAAGALSFGAADRGSPFSRRWPCSSSSASSCSRAVSDRSRSRASASPRSSSW